MVCGAWTCACVRVWACGRVEWCVVECAGPLLVLVTATEEAVGSVHVAVVVTFCGG